MGNAQRKETPSLDWTLGDRLGKSLKFAGVSAQDMAEYLGVARNTVSLMAATCVTCEATPGDNDHCVWDGTPHTWHRCDGIVAPDSNCPQA